MEPQIVQILIYALIVIVYVLIQRADAAKKKALKDQKTKQLAPNDAQTPVVTSFIERYKALLEEERKVSTQQPQYVNYDEQAIAKMGQYKDYDTDIEDDFFAQAIAERDRDIHQYDNFFEDAKQAVKQSAGQIPKMPTITSLPPTNTAPVGNAIKTFLQGRQNLRRAFIASEIFKRKY
ncbi:hypothetical protein [Eisenibacter elegans]|uniref:hypothetical protein n=1 Tax=Eisenibacter elegans TaxID=997 RepID=UPI0004124707|nr:hypothetical protein [Eisenibacter elegans]